MRIELLYVAGCPHCDLTRNRIQAVLNRLNLDTEVIEREITDVEEAKDLRFTGSPTLRVDGADVDPGNEGTAYGLSCRLYDDGQGPSEEAIRSALLAATNG